MSNNKEILIDVKENDIKSIFIKHFKFKTNLRDHLGKLKPLEMELDKIKDWREIPELKYCSSKGVYTTKFQFWNITPIFQFF